MTKKWKRWSIFTAVYRHDRGEKGDGEVDELDCGRVARDGRQGQLDCG